MKSTPLGVLLVLALLAIAPGPTRADEHLLPGEQDFVRYCSACHGEQADGQGPVANVLTPRPPALNRLNRKYGRPLGTQLVSYVMGLEMPRAHGTSEMPVWGRRLAEGGDDTKAVQTIWRIVHFLDRIQIVDETQP